MKIKTTGDLLKETIIFGTLMPMKAADWQIKSFKDDAGNVQTKTTADGKALYRCPASAMLIVDGVITREDKSVTAAVLHPVDIVPGKFYEPAGNVMVVTYENNGRVAHSITIDTLKEKGFVQVNKD